MNDKLTWKGLRILLRRQFPETSRQVVHWEPHGYMQLRLWLNDGTMKVYDGEKRECVDTGQRWKHD